MNYMFPTKNGQLLSTQDFPNGNMLRSTAELLLLASDNILPGDRYSYYKGIEDCRHDLGNFSRYPDRKENTSVDDLLVIGTNNLYAKYILEEARRNWGCISIDGKKSWDRFIFRFQGMWQNLRIMACEDVGIIGQLIWSFNLAVLNARKPITDQDNWTLSSNIVVSYEKSRFNSWICNLAVKYWRSKKTRPTADIMADYIGIPDHPLVLAWKKYN